MNSIINDIKDFYNENAKSFHITRKKIWPEFEYILKEIKKSTTKNIKILEIGCGDGRFAGFLESKLKRSFKYTGVDISQGLINIAQNEYPYYDFYVDSMNDFLAKADQEKYDFIIMIAAFQHLPNKNYRLNYLKNAYRSLKYGGKIIMTNWSFSNWFIKKYKIALFHSFLKFFISLGIYKINDLYIPWKEKEKTYHRYYHIFTKNELKNLFKLSSFIIKNFTYIDKNGLTTDEWKQSRNSIIIGEKNVFN